MNLEPLDYKILEYVSLHEDIAKEELINHFKSENRSVEYRLNVMTMPLLNENMPPGINSHPARYKQNVLSSYSGLIRITEYGRKVLEDYNEQKSLQKKKDTENRLWNFVSITIAVIALLKSFWPEITSLWQQLMQSPK